jgi:hypothetical protein
VCGGRAAWPPTRPLASERWAAGCPLTPLTVLWPHVLSRTSSRLPAGSTRSATRSRAVRPTVSADTSRSLTSPGSLGSPERTNLLGTDT